jgi:hypothetical protein
MKIKRTSAFVTLAASITTVVGIAGPASAAEGCPSGQVCLYYNSGEEGSYEHWSTSGEYDLFNYTFSNWGNGSGYGQTVGNNAASVTNNTGETVWILSTVDGNWYSIAPGFSGTFSGGLANLYNHDGDLSL